MKRLDKRGATQSLKAGRVLMVTYSNDGASYSMDNGQGVALKAALALTGQPADKISAPAGLQSDLFIVPNDDGLFPGFSQTWKAII